MSILLRFKLFIIPLSISIILTACSSVSSISSLIGGRHKYDHAQNFETMKKYNFNPVSNELKSNPDFRFIQQSGSQLAIENIMAAKKLTKERYAPPDFWLNYYYSGEQNITVGQLNDFFHYNLGLAWNDKYGIGKGIADSSYSFSKKTLIIDLVSNRNNQLIWRGSAPVGISESDSYDEKKTALHRAVKVIMDPFPPENDFDSLKHAIPE